MRCQRAPAPARNPPPPHREHPPPGILQLQETPSARSSVQDLIRAPHAHDWPGRPGRDMGPTSPLELMLQQKGGGWGFSKAWPAGELHAQLQGLRPHSRQARQGVALAEEAAAAAASERQREKTGVKCT